MSWFKVDDALWRSPKLTGVSLAATGLWVRAGSWCRDNKMGGYVPRGALRLIAPGLSDDETDALAQELVDAKVEGIHEHGLWIQVANGWQFHDWEQFQPEDELEAHRRESISNIRREAGLRGAQARWQTDGKNGFANTKHGNPGSRARPRVGSPTPTPSRSDPSSPEIPRNDLTGSGPDLIQSPSKDLTGSARVAGRPTPVKPTGDAKAAETKSPFRSKHELEVFEFWSEQLWRQVHRDGRAPRATGRRLSVIRARLREFTVEQLKLAIAKVAKSPFHLGENDVGKPYIEPETIMRNREKVEGWLGTREKSVASGGTAFDRQMARVRELKAQEAREASK